MTHPPTNDIVNRRDQLVRSMLNASFDIRSRHKHRFINGRGAFDELTADHCILFLRDLLVWTSHNNKSEFLARKIISLAQPFGSEPLGSTLEKWDEKHLARWLRFDGNAVCSPRGAWRIAESLAKHCRKVIGEDCGDLARIVNAQHPGLEAFARALVEAVDEKAIPAWTKPYGYEPRIDSTFNAAPRSFDDDSLKAVAKEVRGHLQEVAGPRVAVVRGTAHSGKKVVLRHLIKHCEPKRSLLLRNGVSIPILALALDEHDQQSFVDAVYRFFASARYREAEVERRSLELDGEAKLSRIAAMAREVPACVVLADIAMIEEDEIVRSLAGSHATELIVSLINGHRFTRVAFTTKLASDLGDASLEASLRCEHARTFRVPAKLDLAEVFRALHLPGAEPNAAGGEKVSGLAARLCQIALEIANGRDRLGNFSTQTTLQRALADDDIRSMLLLLCDGLLDEDEFLVVALISASHDGLRTTVLERILAKFVGLCTRLGTSLPGDEIGLRQRVLQIVTALRGLVQERTVVVDASLSTQSGGKEEETLYAIDDGWRRHILRIWCEKHRAAARTMHWLIAREAADQSRALRHARWQGRHLASFGRDVQALHAVLTSLDTTSIIEWASAPHDDTFASHANLAALRVSPRARGRGIEISPHYVEYAENAILPPLRRDEEPPHSAVVLQYAYRQLYLRDLEGSDFGLLSRQQDATTRLGILLRFLVPDAPWLKLEDRKLTAELRHYPHLVSALQPDEVLELLVATAVSALRLERYDIVSAAVRIGEQYFEDKKGTGISRLALVRLLRTEIDAGLLFGGNPQARRPAQLAGADVSTRWPEMRLRDVCERIESLLAGPLATDDDVDPHPEWATAYGKMVVKLGEAYHVSGRFRDAQAAFETAVLIETRLLAVSRTRSLAPVLGGRGARAYLRHLLERVRITARKGRWPPFVFIDELALPAPPQAVPSPDWHEAEHVQALLTRRVSRERIVDAIGLKIDAARLSVLRHDFASAYYGLASVLSDRLLSGSSLELLLELMAVQSRYLLDGAILCLQANAWEMADPARRGEAPHLHQSSSQIAAIARFLSLEQGARPLDVAYFLHQRAHESLSRLGHLINTRRVRMGTYAIYRDYLQVLYAAIDTRFVEQSQVAAYLVASRTKLSAVVDEMRRCDYRMHRIEALRLLRSLDRAIGKYADLPQSDSRVAVAKDGL